MQMARSKGVEELADPAQRRTLHEYACTAAETRLARECTFQPDTRKPAVPAAHYTPAKAAFTVHEHEPQELVARCAQPAARVVWCMQRCMRAASALRKLPLHKTRTHECSMHRDSSRAPNARALLQGCLVACCVSERLPVALVPV
jgi:hypothetical protein